MRCGLRMQHRETQRKLEQGPCQATYAACLTHRQGTLAEPNHSSSDRPLVWSRQSLFLLLPFVAKLHRAWTSPATANSLCVATRRTQSVETGYKNGREVARCQALTKRGMCGAACEPGTVCSMYCMPT